MKSHHTTIQNYIASLQKILGALDVDSINSAANAVIQAFENRQTVFVCGNGGSASTASHMAADLGKNTVTQGKARLRVLSLNDNVAWFSALANDLGYENVFVEQIATLLQRDDILIAISASGNSPNVVKAAEYTRAHGGKVIAFVGFDGGKLKQLADISVHFQSRDYGPVEDGHLILNHIFVEAVREHIRNS